MSAARPFRLLLHTVCIAVLMISCFLFLIVSSVVCPAEDSLLSGASFELLFTEDLTETGGVIQGIAVSDFYIYTLTNTADDPAQPDIVRAYYRTDRAPDGTPVQQYSLAKINDLHHWEHGNSMTWNPNTNLLIVAPYTSLEPQNRGCLLFMDPETLEPAGSVKISDSFDVLAVTCDPDQNVYYIQTNDEAMYSIVKLNADFEIIDDFGPQDPAPGYNFQAFCIAGDYLLQFPLTLFLNIGNYLEAYSVSAREKADLVPLDFGLEQVSEPEAIARLDDTGFLVLVHTAEQAYFYRLTLPNLPPAAPLFGGDTAAAYPLSVSQNTETPASFPLTSDLNEVPETDAAANAGTAGVLSAASAGNGGTAAITENENPDLAGVRNENRDPAVTNTVRIPAENTGFSPLWILLPGSAAFAVFWHLNLQRIRRTRRVRDARLRRIRRELLSDL